jgi:hypothetical protein
MAKETFSKVGPAPVARSKRQSIPSSFPTPWSSKLALENGSKNQEKGGYSRAKARAIMLLDTDLVDDFVLVTYRIKQVPFLTNSTRQSSFIRH